MISKLEKYVTKSGYSRRVFSPQTFREANFSTFSFKLLCKGAERVVNEFGRSPTKSYSDLLGGMRSVCFGSGPLKFFSRSGLFWSIGFGFLKLFAPAAWSTHKGLFDCALLDWERAIDRRSGFAPLRPRVDDDCARCLLLVTFCRG